MRVVGGIRFQGLRVFKSSASRRVSPSGTRLSWAARSAREAWDLSNCRGRKTKVHWSLTRASASLASLTPFPRLRSERFLLATTGTTPASLRTRTGLTCLPPISQSQVVITTTTFLRKFARDLAVSGVQYELFTQVLLVLTRGSDPTNSCKRRHYAIESSCELRLSFYDPTSLRNVRVAAFVSLSPRLFYE